MTERELAHWECDCQQMLKWAAEKMKAEPSHKYGKSRAGYEREIERGSALFSCECACVCASLSVICLSPSLTLAFSHFVPFVKYPPHLLLLVLRSGF